MTDVKQIVNMEAEAAKEALPPFCSTKEGWAEMLKELDEVVEQTKILKKAMAQMWEMIKAEEEADAVSATYVIEDEAVKASRKAVSLAVQAQRFRAAFERKGDGEWHF